MKKTLSILLSLILALSAMTALPLSVFALSGDGTAENPLFTGNSSDLEQGDKFQMGMYPQTKVTDDDTIAALAAIDCTMTSYGYLKNGTETVDMTYADIAYNGEAYRKVTINEYRPSDTDDNATADRSYMDDNGYYAGETYYFKWEPIVWQVLAKQADGVYVMSKTVLDTQPFNSVYKTITWEECTLKTWLNNSFYNSAFSENEKSLICDNTAGKIRLLLNDEVINPAYGFANSYVTNDTARMTTGSDYAKSQNLLSEIRWFLRQEGDMFVAPYVTGYNGFANSAGNVAFTYSGVRPAFKLKLDSTVTTSDTDLCHIVGHDYGTPTYNWAQENGVWKCTAERVCANDANHKETETVTAASAVSQAATCMAQGKTKYTATFTNSAFAQQEKTETDIPVNSHDFSNNALYCKNNCGTVNPDYTFIEVPQASDSFTYNGEEKTGVPAGTGYTVTENSTATNAGNYTATVKLNDLYAWSNNGEGNELSDVTLEWSIQKAEPKYEVPTDIVGYKGDKLSNIELPSGWSWKNENTDVGGVGENAFPAVYTPDDTNNYYTAQADITVTVKNSGWIKENGKWYFYKNGEKLKYYRTVDGKNYYFNGNGEMMTGWIQFNSTKKWHYFKSDGSEATGWFYANGKWYYSNAKGEMQTGWFKDGGKWYYLDSNGAMLINTSKKIGSKTYNFNSSGVCTNP